MLDINVGEIWLSDAGAEYEIVLIGEKYEFVAKNVSNKELFLFYRDGSAMFGFSKIVKKKPKKVSFERWHAIYKGGNGDVNMAYSTYGTRKEAEKVWGHSGLIKVVKSEFETEIE